MQWYHSFRILRTHGPTSCPAYYLLTRGVGSARLNSHDVLHRLYRCGGINGFVGRADCLDRLQLRPTEPNRKASTCPLPPS